MRQFNNFNFSILFLLIGLLFVNTGCVTTTSKKDTSAIDGGIYKTVNKGDIWQQKVLIPSISGAPKSFSAVSVASMALDPSDEKAIYFGSEGNGMFYSYNGGNEWMVADKLIRATIRSIAVDNNFKCTIYAAAGNRLYKSTDCNRSWKEVYYDNDVAARVSYVAIDHYNSSNIYIGISRGDVIKSENGGQDWYTITRLDSEIKKIVIDPNDSRKMYALTGSKVHITTDGGVSWVEFESLNKAIKEYKLSDKIKDLVVTKSEERKIFVATYYGLIRSDNGGETWEKISLIPPEKKATINAIAVNDNNTKEIYYVTNTTFYRSSDGGESWATKKLPTTKAGWNLIIDPTDPNIIYMGVKGLQQK